MTPFNKTQVRQEIKSDTLNYTQDFIGSYSFESERDFALEICLKHYSYIDIYNDNDGYYISASNTIKFGAEIDAYEYNHKGA